MAVTRTLFRNIAAHTSKPDNIVEALNDSISEGNDANMFITVFVGALDLPTGRLRYCNAGHDSPFIQATRLRCDSNIPIGIIPGRKYSQQETKVAPGTTIFLYTDGLTEAENETHELFGRTRVANIIESFVQSSQNESEGSPQELIEGMIDAVHQFVGETEQSDDLTMLAIKYTLKKKTNRFSRQLTLHNDVQEVPQLAAFVDEVCEAVGFDISTTMKMNLAIEEAVVNVMNYAYPVNVKGEVRIQAEVNDVRLKIIISDDGMPFDPTEKPDADITLSVEERSIGGLGIHLVRQIMDSINYERINDQNIFTLLKKLG
jgi:sigma-B regulation protein RsbU (phosphoserine phosphatase)